MSQNSMAQGPNIPSIGKISLGGLQYFNNPLQNPQPQSIQGSSSQHSSMGMQSHIGPKLNTSGGGDQTTQVLSRARLQEVVREVDPTLQLDEEVEDMLLQMADDFIDSTLNSACALAKYRHAPTTELKDIQLHLERQFSMWIPGFGNDELRPYKRAAVTEAHKQRMALIRRTMKKY